MSLCGVDIQEMFKISRVARSQWYCLKPPGGCLEQCPVGQSACRGLIFLDGLTFIGHRL